MKTNPAIIIVAIILVSVNAISYIDRALNKRDDQLFFPKGLQQTEELTTILEKSGTDRSMSNIKAVAESSGFDVESVGISTPYTTMGIDKIALRVNDTVLLFEAGQFSYEIKYNASNHN